MKCEQIQILVEDYVDSALDRKATALVDSHVAACAACTSFYQELSREQEIYARYERDVEVTPVLWASIEARIKQERAARPMGLISRLREQVAGAFAAPRLTPAFTAALVMIAIAITVAVMSYLNSSNHGLLATGNKSAPTATSAGNDNRATPAPAPQPGRVEPDQLAKGGSPSASTPNPVKVRTPAPHTNLAPNAVLTPAQLVRDAEQKYLTAIAMLSRDVNRHRSQLDPTLLARFDASLSDIDRTIKETRRVVRENPGDPIALQYLLAAYSKKVEVLRGMTTD